MKNQKSKKTKAFIATISIVAVAIMIIGSTMAITTHNKSHELKIQGVEASSPKDAIIFMNSSDKFAVIKNTSSLEQLSRIKKSCSIPKLDSLGRPQAITMYLSKNDLVSYKDKPIIPEDIKPSGWIRSKFVKNNETYEILDGKEIYIKRQIVGLISDVSEGNIITSTQFMDETISEFESMIFKYLKNNKKNHVIYRAMPFFDEDNKLASGVQIEAYSVEDNGEGVCFNVFCYNKQPGINISYKNGANTEAITTTNPISTTQTAKKNESKKRNKTAITTTTTTTKSNVAIKRYVIDFKNRIFHNEDCSEYVRASQYVTTIIPSSRNDILKQGFKACSKCHP